MDVILKSGEKFSTPDPELMVEAIRRQIFAYNSIGKELSSEDQKKVERLMDIHNTLLDEINKEQQVEEHKGLTA